jgi:hypothetical protein
MTLESMWGQIIIRKKPKAENLVLLSLYLKYINFSGLFSEGVFASGVPPLYIITYLDERGSCVLQRRKFAELGSKYVVLEREYILPLWWT